LSGEPTNGNARWQTVGTFAAIAVILFGGLITTLVKINTVQNTADAQAVHIAALERQSTFDQEKIAELRAIAAKNGADLIEIETQFCASDSIRNQITAWDLRIFAVLWKKTFGDVLPTDNAFYGQIGRCATGMR